jgi:hypothetical protein
MGEPSTVDERDIRYRGVEVIIAVLTWSFVGNEVFRPMIISDVPITHKFHNSEQFISLESRLKQSR